MRILWLLLLLFWASPGLAAESPQKVELPPPEVLVTPDAISLAVVQARPDDEGFRALLKTAWEGFQGVSGQGTNSFLKVVLRAIQGDDPYGLSSFLPVQAVRVDQLGPQGKPHPTLAVTVAGWPGLQTFFYTGLAHNHQGQKYPTQDYEAATLVLRDGWEDPTASRILTRVKGTFLSFPTIDQAETVIERLDKQDASLAQTALTQALTGLDTQADTYGVILNRNGSMLKFLLWLNQYDVGRVIERVGRQRMDEVLEEVTLLAWEGDLQSNDSLRFLARFETTSKEARQALREVLLEAAEVLREHNRAGELQVTGLRNQVLVDFTMVGYRRTMLGYIRGNF